MIPDLQSVISIYRSLRRQVRLLPTEYLRCVLSPHVCKLVMTDILQPILPNKVRR